MKHQKLSTTPEISKRMANVHLKASKAETDLAKELWRRGLRYRKNYRKLPGSPDIAILKHKIAVFVDGEFWHGKDWGQKKECLKTNQESNRHGGHAMAGAMQWDSIELDWQQEE